MGTKISPVPYADRRNVILSNVQHGSVLQGRENVIYAELHDAETGDLIISATIEYILNVAPERGYNFVNAK